MYVPHRLTCFEIYAVCLAQHAKTSTYQITHSVASQPVMMHMVEKGNLIKPFRWVKVNPYFNLVSHMWKTTIKIDIKS